MHGRASYGTIQILTIKRLAKIQEIKDIRSNAENGREQQTLICERIPSVVDFAQHGYHDLYYIVYFVIKRPYVFKNKYREKERR